jgi:hypothetical protein
MEAKKEALRSYGEKCFEYGRRLFSVEQEQQEEAPPSTDDEAGGDDEKSANSNDEVVKSVTDAAAHVNRAADIVSASVSSNDVNEMTRAGKEASKAASEASIAAQTAANAAPLPPSSSGTRGFLSRQWNKWLQKCDGRKEEPADKE